ncbi:MAG: DUF2190 family protein [Opitutaceae bacterium]|nr:DUF2190 family protein [Opitutaceae bacterium]
MITIISAITIAFCLLFAGALLVSWARGFRRRGRLIPAINTLPGNVGTSKHSRRYLASAAVATRYLLAKLGADAEHIAVVAATSDQPIGVMTDEAAAAEDPINVELLGVTGRTLPLVAAGAIATGADVYQTAAGKVDVKPTAAGTYWRIGTALTAATADGDPIEVATSRPRKLIVIAALGNVNGEIAALTFTAGGATGPEVEALRDKCEELADDVRAIAAALNGDADVALATT